jgi:hypothetical protein
MVVTLETAHDRTLPMKRTASCLAVLAIAACSPTVPESGPCRLGFGDYSSYSSTRIERERLLRGQTDGSAADPL